ncbi:MAG: hypothetical protein KGL39_09140 [Patescibacteria group bacterium]|nr:hypothetical protein [Patescibacteria group bacterium]
MKSIIGWHFARRNNWLGYGDNRKIMNGESLSVEGEIVPCKNGLHVGVTAMDALRYASGPRLYRCELSGDLRAHGDPIDKYAGRTRLALAGGEDATPFLRASARQFAADVLHLWDTPEIVRQYLLSGDKSLRRAAAEAARAEAARAAAAFDIRAKQSAWLESAALAWIERGEIPAVTIPEVPA